MPTADIPFVASANTPEDPWWDWQAEEDPRVQERVWAAIEALEDTARAGRLGLMPLATRIRVSELELGFKAPPVCISRELLAPYSGSFDILCKYLPKLRSRASSTVLSSGLYNNSITSLLVGVTSETRPFTIFPYSALSEPVQPLYTLPLHLFILYLAYIGHALRIALAVAYGILKTCNTVAAANRHT
ncbi:hypothetical protein EDB85DRAFT_1884739 [Lactarius pseudohatsudake]|nr:hypothetical protein EDB85DRAFT_1884739 [Lactarius pseudohatsudake]